MKDLIPVPSKGTPLRASWGAAVANGMNAFASMSSIGMLSREGMTGTGSQPLPKNMRDRTASGIQPRQFTLMARLETRQSGNNTEYRTVVEFYNFYNHEAVTWSSHQIPSQSELVNGWNQCLSSEWSTSQLPATTIYLNVRIDIEQNWQGTQVLPPKNTSFWNVSSTPIENRYSVGANISHICHAYELGIVTSGFVRQITDGTFNFMDLAVFEGGGGSGSEGDVDGTNYPMPFQYKRTYTENQSTGEVTSSWSIVNNRFYWDGVEKTIADYTPSATCTVYLVCSQTEPSSANPNPTWTFSLAESAGSAPSGGSVLNFKLYTFADHIVTMDYRTTFLSINSPHKVSFFEVSPTSGSNSVKLDATGQNANVVASNGNKSAKLDATSSGVSVVVTTGARTVTIDPGDLPQGTEAKFHTLTVNHSDGTADRYGILSDDDIEVYDAKGTVLSDISIEYSSSTHELTYTKTLLDLETGDETTDGPYTIFTAVAHSTNS